MTVEPPAWRRMRWAGRARGLGLVLLLNAIFGGLWVSFLRQLSPYDDTRRKFVNDGGSEHTSELHDGEAPPARLPEKGLVVHVFASDTGSWRAVEPVARQAAASGATVRVCLCGAAARQRASAAGRASFDGSRASFDGRGLDVVGHGEAALRRLALEPHDVTLIGLSTSRAGAAEGALVLCTSVASAAVGLIEDRPATALPTLEFVRASCAHRAEDLTARGVVLCVHDDVAERLVREHTAFRGRVVATGGPQYDRTFQRGQLGSGAAAEERARLRKQLGLSDDAIAVLAVGQPEGAAELARLIVDGVPPELVGRVRVLFRPHPRAKASDAAAAAEALRSAPAALHDFDTAALARLASAEEALAAADAVVSGFSTVNTHAILRGVRGVVYAATPSLAELYRLTKKLEVPPEVAAGAAWRVGKPGELTAVLRALVAGEAGSAELRRVVAAQGRLRDRNRGGAAERAWRAVLGAAVQQRRKVRPSGEGAAARARTDGLVVDSGLAPSPSPPLLTTSNHR